MQLSYASGTLFCTGSGPWMADEAGDASGSRPKRGRRGGKSAKAQWALKARFDRGEHVPKAFLAKNFPPKAAKTEGDPLVVIIPEPSELADRPKIGSIFSSRHPEVLAKVPPVPKPKTESRLYLPGRASSRREAKAVGPIAPSPARVTVETRAVPKATPKAESRIAPKADPPVAKRLKSESGSGEPLGEPASSSGSRAAPHTPPKAARVAPSSPKSPPKAKLSDPIAPETNPSIVGARAVNLEKRISIDFHKVLDSVSAWGRPGHTIPLVNKIAVLESLRRDPRIVIGVCSYIGEGGYHSDQRRSNAVGEVDELNRFLLSKGIPASRRVLLKITTDPNKANLHPSKVSCHIDDKYSVIDQCKRRGLVVCQIYPHRSNKWPTSVDLDTALKGVERLTFAREFSEPFFD